MAESLEYQTLVRCRSKLVTALLLDPPDVADVLISKGLIPPSVASEMSELARSAEKSRRLVECIFNKVELSSDSYHSFIDAFTECGWLDDLIGILNAAHRELSSAVDVPKGAEQRQSQAEQSTVADSTKQVEGLKLVQSQTQTDLAVIRSNEEEIKAQFSLLLINVKKELESQGVDVSDVHHFLVNFFQKDDCFPSATTITYDSIFRATTVSRLWDYQHYSPLEKLTSHLLPNNPAVTSLIANYKASLTGFMMITELIPYMRKRRLEEVAEQQSSMKPLKPEHYRQITFVLNLGRRVSQLSLLYVQKLWMSVAEEYELPCLTAIVDSITCGSLRITWLVLPSVMNKFSVRAKFFKKEKIAQVIVDNVIFYDEIEMMGHERTLLGICLEGEASITQFSAILEKGVDPDVHDEDGKHPLWYASYYGRRDLVELLILNSRAEVNLTTEDEFGETALITAIGHNHLGTASLLLNLGANVNKKNKKGKSPLWCASCDGKDDIVLLLLEHNAQIDLPNEDELGETALIAAIRQDHISTATLLLDHGADINKQNKKGKSPLSMASYYGKDDLVLLLLEHKAEIDLPNDDEFGETALIAAVNKGHLSTAALLLLFGADVNKQNKKGQSPLWKASYKGKDDLVLLLLEHKAEINLPTDNELGETPLIAAVNQRRLTIAALLLDHGADANKQNKKGQSPLYLASYLGKNDLVLLLLEHKAEIDLPSDDEFGETALIAAVNQGRLTTAALLLLFGADVNKQNKKGKSPLSMASYKGKDDLVLLLLEHKAEIDLPTDDELGETALIAAVNQGCLTTAALLLDHGADVNKQNKPGFTPLYFASKNDHTELVELLLKKGARVNQGSQPPLFAASFNGRVDIVKRLIRHGADVNLPVQNDEFGSTPLGVACINNHPKVVTVLIENGAVVDSTDKKGMSALHLASDVGNTDVVNLLLKYHAQLEIKNNEGRTALMIASWRGHLKIVKVLLGAGAETDVQDQEGLTSLMLATKNGHTDVVKALLEAKADPNLREKNTGWSALFFTVQEGYLKIAELLIAAGAVVDKKDKDDATAYVIAEVNGHSDLCELLEKHSRLQRETETAVTEEQHKQVKKSYQRLLKIFDLLEDTLLKDRKEKRLHQANQRNVSTLADVNEN